MHLNASSSPSHRHGGAVALHGDQPAQLFPDLDFGSAPVNAAAHVAPGTDWRTAVGWLLVGGGLLFATISTMGGILLLLVFSAIVGWFQARRVRAQVNGQAVRVDSTQLPQLNACVQAFASRLSLKEIPEVYVHEDGAVNGFALRLAGKDMLLLTDDAVWGALQSKNPRTLGFIVGHELAHVALGHTGYLRSIIRAVFPPLRRLDELSADNVARALVGDAQVAFDGVKLLLVGPQLSHYVSDAALRLQAEAVVANGLSAKVEKTMTHPLLMRRLHNVLR